MYRNIALSVVTLAGLMLGTETARAEVFIRLPFVRVEVGEPGVFVRAPFVRVWVPQAPPVYQAVPPPGAQVVPQLPPPAMPPAGDLPMPKALPGQSNVLPPPPQPVPLPGAYPTLNEFAKTFQPRAGQYDVTIVNPVTKQPTQVRFSLPEGSPRRVIVNRDEIEFRYSLLKFVRIQFDADGAVIMSR